MGLFDFFGREPKTKNNSRESAEKTVDRLFNENNNFNSFEKPTNAPVTVFKPTSFEDVEHIINCLRNGKTAVVHLTDLKNETAIRILDLLSGAVYALNGGVYEMEANIFMFSPSGVEIR